jgi:hypothetical protein
MNRAATWLMGHSTKSLRSSPLRGGKSREARSRSSEGSDRAVKKLVSRIEVSSSSLRIELPTSDTTAVALPHEHVIEDRRARGGVRLRRYPSPAESLDQIAGIRRCDAHHSCLERDRRSFARPFWTNLGSVYAVQRLSLGS